MSFLRRKTSRLFRRTQVTIFDKRLSGRLPVHAIMLRLYREGGGHSIWLNPFLRKIASVPRHRVAGRAPGSDQGDLLISQIKGKPRAF